MSARLTAAALNAALVDTVTRNMTWLNAVLDELGWCADLPHWPDFIVLTAPADIYLLQAHALAVLYGLAEAKCACHSGERGRIAKEIIGGWRVLVDHAISFAVLCPSGRVEDLQTYRDRYRAVEAAFQRHAGVLLGR